LLSAAISHDRSTGTEKLTSELFSLPGKIEEVLQLDDEIKLLAEQFAEKATCLVFG